MRQQVNRKMQLLSLSDSGRRRRTFHWRVLDPGGLESEGLTLRSGRILRGRTPHTSQMSDSQALTEFDMVTVQGQTGLSPSESETVTSYTVSAAAADLSIQCESKKISPAVFLTIFSKWLGIFKQIFCTPILRSFLHWTTNFYSVISNFDEVMPY